MNELALFAGAGGGILGGTLLGWRTVCAVEIDAYAASVLVARQNDGILPPFPIWDDVRTFDGKPWRGIVDVVSGGFPCEDISCAGKRAGLDGGRSGLWREMRRIIGEVRPKYAFVENSPMLVIRGLDRVLGDMAEMGYDAKWGIISAGSQGAPHERKRCWIVANANKSVQSTEHKREQNYRAKELDRVLSDCIGNLVTNPDQIRLRGSVNPWEDFRVDALSKTAFWGDVSTPLVCRNDDGVAARLDRLKALGNGQVPCVAAKAWCILCQNAFENPTALIG